MASQPRARTKPKDDLPTITIVGRSATFSGSYGGFLDYLNVAAGSGLTPVTRVGGQARPNMSVPPVDDPLDSGDNDPSNFPPFIDPSEPIIEQVPPEERGGVSEIDSVLVTGTRPTSDPLAAVPFSEQPAPAPVQPPKRRPRRSRPPPRRTRPVRPQRPAPGPRIPIPVEPLPEVKVTAPRFPFFTLLTLVPYWIQGAMRLDQYGTEHMFNRLFPPRKRDEQRTPDQRPRDADKNPAGDPRAVAEPVPGDIPTLVVEGSRPSAFPAPAPVRQPSLLPIDVGYAAPLNRPAGFPNPRSNARRRPRSGPRFTLDLGPQPLGGFNVLPQPFPTSVPRPVRKPSPSAPAGPSSSPPKASPAPIIGKIEPVPDLGPVPVEELDKCRCPQRQARKKRQQRTICSSGSYTQTARGLLKKPTRYFDCETGVDRPAPSRPTSTNRTPHRPRYNKPRVPGGLPLPDKWTLPT